MESTKNYWFIRELDIEVAITCCVQMQYCSVIILPRLLSIRFHAWAGSPRESSYRGAPRLQLKLSNISDDERDSSSHIHAVYVPLFLGSLYTSMLHLITRRSCMSRLIRTAVECHVLRRENRYRRLEACVQDSRKSRNSDFSHLVYTTK